MYSRLVFEVIKISRNFSSATAFEGSSINDVREIVNLLNTKDGSMNGVTASKMDLILNRPLIMEQSMDFNSSEQVQGASNSAGGQIVAGSCKTPAEDQLR